MEESDKLITSDLRKQSNSMIKDLKKSNQDLIVCRNQIKEIGKNTQLEGEAYKELKAHLGDYIYVINAMIFANGMHIDALNTLKVAIGDEDLIGTVIYKHINDQQAIVDSENKEMADALERIKNDVIYREFVYSVDVIGKLRRKIDKDTELLNSWKAKLDKFDDICSMTKDLFEGITSFRKTIDAVISSMRSRFINGAYQGAYYSGVCFRLLNEALMSCMTEEEVNLDLGDAYVNLSHFKTLYRGGKTEWFIPGGFENFIRKDDWDGDDKEELRALILNDNNGFISLMDVATYMNHTHSGDVSVYKYMQNAYKMFMDKKMDQYFVVKKKDEEMYTPMQMKNIEKVLDEIAKENGYKGATWNKGKKVPLDDIKDQLLHDIPVLLNIGEPAKNRQLPTYKINKFGDICSYNTIYNKTVSVIGVQYYGDIENDDERTLLKIISNGQVEYIDYDELQELKNLDMKSKNDSHKSGGYNTSHVNYE